MFGSALNLEYITIPSSVTRVGDRAFNNQNGQVKALKRITFENTNGPITFQNYPFYNSTTFPDFTEVHIKSLENWIRNTYALQESNPTYPAKHLYLDNPDGTSTEVTTVAFPDGTTSIPRNCLDSLVNVTSVIIPEGVTIINDQAFRGTGITSVLLPSTLTTIKSNAFMSSALQSVVMPDSVVALERNVFEGCASLVSVTLPQRLQSLPIQAFMDCTSLERIYNLEDINCNATQLFLRCSSVSEIYVSSMTEYLKNKYGTDSSTCPFGPSTAATRGIYVDGVLQTSITVPPSISSISPHLFYKNNTLSGTIIIPSSVTSIGMNALGELSSITNVYSYSPVELPLTGGNGTGMVYTNGPKTIGTGTWNGFAHIIIKGTTTVQANSTWINTGNITVKSVRVLGEFNVTTNSYGISNRSIPQLEFIEFGSTVYGTKPVANGFSPNAHCVLHLSKTDGRAFDSSSFTDSGAMSYLLSRIETIYVGDGSSAAADQLVKDMYLADSSWEPYYSKLDLWSNYNGEYKTYTLPPDPAA